MAENDKTREKKERKEERKGLKEMGRERKRLKEQSTMRGERIEMEWEKYK